MQRRYFILGGLAGIASLAAWRYESGRDVDAIAMVIRKRLDYLQLDDAGVQAYATDLAKLNAVSPARLKALNLIAPVYTRFSLSAGDNPLAYGIRHGEERIVATYLMSSDFFINGADVDRVVKYLGYYDSRRACSNPFARPAVDAPA